jgi:excinuclease ABC subunit A
MTRAGASTRSRAAFEGVIPNMERRWRETDSAWVREEFERYQNNRPCGTCGGFRLQARGAGGQDRRAAHRAGQQMSIREALAWVEAVPAQL